MPHGSLRTRSLLSSHWVGTIAWQDPRHLVEANDAFVRMCGRTREELIGGGVQWTDLFPARTRGPSPNGLELFEATGPAAPIEMQLRRKSGWLRPVLVGAFARDAAPHSFFVVPLGEDSNLPHASAEIEARYLTLIETTETGFVIVDEHGRVVDANYEYVRLTGRASIEEVKGRSALEWTAPYDVERNAREIAKVTTTGIVRNLEIDYVHPDGTPVPVEINATVIWDGGVRRWLALCRDISERRRAERVLREGEAILRRITENIRDVFLLTNADTQEVLYVNPAFETIWGRPGRDACKSIATLLETVHPDDRPALVEMLARASRDEASAADYRIFKPDGSIRWIRNRTYPIPPERGSARLIAGIAEDVTEQRHADETRRQMLEELQQRFDRNTEEIRRANARLRDESVEHQRLLDALKRSEAQYRLLADNAIDMISTHSLTGIYKYVSPACKRLLGYEPEELIGRDPYELFHPDDQRVVEVVHINVLESSDVHTVAYRKRRKDGQYIWFETTSRTIRDPRTEAPIEITCISRDITERKLLEEREHRRQWELAHLARLGTLGELASGLAHELNQPLAAITNYVAVAQDRLSGAQDARPGIEPLLDKVAHQATRAAEIIRRMRNLIRKKEPHWSTIHLRELVLEAIGVLGHEIRLNGVRVAPEVAEGVPLVLADRVQIEQVLINLLRNAIEAMAIAPDNGGRPKEIRVRVAGEPEGRVRVDVQDTGPGFDAATSDRLFEPFYSTKQEGLGLGLSISRTIIEAHGGRLWAGSETPSGARVSFSLPVTRKTP